MGSIWYFFASQCKPLINKNSIPNNQSYGTNARLSSIKFKEKNILKIKRSLDVSKAHGFDDLPVRMIKLFDPAIVKPLSVIYRNYLTWHLEHSNICPIDEKNDKQIFNNYRSIFLLPTCGKIFEKLIFHDL